MVFKRSPLLQDRILLLRAEFSGKNLELFNVCRVLLQSSRFWFEDTESPKYIQVMEPQVEVLFQATQVRVDDLQ